MCVWKSAALTIACLLLLPLTSNGVTYYIQPTSGSPCEHKDCLTLEQYAVNVTRYFSPNTTLLLTAGVHTLNNTVVTLERFESLEVLGNAGSLSEIVNTTILCTETSAIMLTDIATVYFKALSIVSCGGWNVSFHNITGGVLPAISACGGWNVSFHNITGGVLPAISAQFVQHFHLINCSMVHNYLSLFAYNATILAQKNVYRHNSGVYGGGMLALNSVVELVGCNMFLDNRAEYGGGIYVANSQLALMDNVAFISNTAGLLGGGIFSYNSSIGFVTDLTKTLNSLCTWSFMFDGNSADGEGGGMFILYSSLSCSGGVLNFTGGNAETGGGIAIYSSSASLSCFTVFLNNLAGYGGAVSVGNSTWTCSTLFGLGNEALYLGGVVYSYFSKLYFISDEDLYSVDVYANMCKSIFGENVAVSGSTFYVTDSTVEFKGNHIFEHNNAGVHGGAIEARDGSIVYMNGTIRFERNAAVFGGATSVIDSTLLVDGNFEFVGNQANYGGAIYADEDSNLTIGGSGIFQSNVANYRRYGGYGGGIHCFGCMLVIKGRQNLLNNSAMFGGGLAFAHYNYKHYLYLAANTSINFTDNWAKKHGGAIVVEGSPLSYCPPKLLETLRFCFIQVSIIKVKLEGPETWWLSSSKDFYAYLDSKNISVYFEHNLAISGKNVYGGAMEKCMVLFHRYLSMDNPSTSELAGVKGNDALSVIMKMDHHSISSPPFKVCSCKASKPDCSQRVIDYTTYPGERASFAIAAVGQVNGLAPAQINATFTCSQNKAWLDEFQELQSIAAACTMLNYTLFSKEHEAVNLSLYVADDQACEVETNYLSIVVNFLPCPYGFSLSLSSNGQCGCEQRLQKYTNSCVVDNQTITHSGGVWVGFDSDSQGLILHPHCPFDYCKLETVSFTLNTTYLQCANGRSGTLCGACKSGLSLNLGSSQCSSCSNVFLLLFLPFAISGFLLVVFLFICKVTVAAGTTSGLIFYANVLAVNQRVFFPSETNILTVFIAWLNLDLGIETCFIDGLDTYTLTWLQFLFPFYIWAIAGIIMLVSHYSMTVSKLIGPTNPVSVLATLFLLSYTKLLRTAIATFSFTTLDYPNDRTVTVWAYDGNIKFLEGKHIPLFLAGLLAFLLLFLPFTLLLVLGQWIEAGSNHKLLSWANNPKVRSFLDAYHAPYKNRHRYWVGLLLMLRFVLFVISAVVDINSPRDPSVNLLALGVVCTGITVLVTSVYKKSLNTILELSFVLNLGILALSCYQVKVEGGNRAAVVNTSMSVALVTFLIIIVYHVSQQLIYSRFWRVSVRPKLIHYRTKLSRHRPTTEDTTEQTACPTAPPPPVPTTFVELREPLQLLESQSS